MLAVFAVGYAAAPLSVANGNFQRQPGFYLAMVLAFNLVGDGLSDALDPRTAR